jgi:AbrB family looped-hinge helix DNA binding protein
MTYKVGAKGQVVLPKELRERHGIKPGDEVVFDDRQDEIVVRRAKSRAQIIESLRGSLAGPGKPLTELLVESRRRDREREDRKLDSFR